MAAGERLRIARSQMGPDWIDEHPFPLHPLHVMGAEEFRRRAARVAAIKAKRLAAGLLFRRTFPWPAVPTGTDEEEKKLAAAELPAVLKKYLKPQGPYSLHADARRAEGGAA